MQIDFNPNEPENQTEAEANKSGYEYVECSFCEQFWQISYPAVLTFGLAGNALCLVAFAEHKLRLETRILCSLCAVIDSLALAAAFAPRWPAAAFVLSTMSPTFCRILTTANYWLPELAAWTLVYLSLDRFLSVHYKFGSRWRLRSRYCVSIFISIGFALLLVNIHFILLPDSDALLQQVSSLKINRSLDDSQKLTIYKPQEVDSQEEIENTLLYNTSKRSTTSRALTNLTREISLSLNRSEVTQQEKKFTRYELVSEISECEAALAGSQWTLWNLVDLALSSLGPFAFIFAFNAAIIVRISKQKKRTTIKRPAALYTRSGVSQSFEGQFQPQRVRSKPISRDLIKKAKTALAARDSRTERSVTVMLLVTTFMFLVMRTPIAVGHSLQMLLSEEKLFRFVEPLVCMAAFAIAEMLAFTQHAIQFYVYFACSAQFRQSLRRQFGIFFNRIGRVLSEIGRRLPDYENGSSVPLELLNPPYPSPTSPATGMHPIFPFNSSNSPSQCSHAFIWADKHILQCYLCLYKRVVHHPSCPFCRDDQRFGCECLNASVEHPAHIVVHLRDRQSPFFLL